MVIFISLIYGKAVKETHDCDDARIVAGVLKTCKL